MPVSSGNVSPRHNWFWLFIQHTHFLKDTKGPVGAQLLKTLEDAAVAAWSSFVDTITSAHHHSEIRGEHSTARKDHEGHCLSLMSHTCYKRISTVDITIMFHHSLPMMVGLTWLSTAQPSAIAFSPSQSPELLLSRFVGHDIFVAFTTNPAWEILIRMVRICKDAVHLHGSGIATYGKAPVVQGELWDGKCTSLTSVLPLMSTMSTQPS